MLRCESYLRYGGDDYVLEVVLLVLLLMLMMMKVMLMVRTVIVGGWYDWSYRYW